MARGSLQRIVHTAGALTEQVLDEVTSESREPRAGKAFNSFERSEVALHGLQTNYVRQLDQSSAPTLIIHGSADTFVPLV